MLARDTPCIITHHTRANTSTHTQTHAPPRSGCGRRARWRTTLHSRWRGGRGHSWRRGTPPAGPWRRAPSGSRGLQGWEGGGGGGGGWVGENVGGRRAEGAGGRQRARRGGGPRGRAASASSRRSTQGSLWTASSATSRPSSPSSTVSNAGSTMACLYPVTRCARTARAGEGVCAWVGGRAGGRAGVRGGPECRNARATSGGRGRTPTRPASTAHLELRVHLWLVQQGGEAQVGQEISVQEQQDLGARHLQRQVAQRVDGVEPHQLQRRHSLGG